jgi:uncharacterized protein DUF4908
MNARPVSGLALICFASAMVGAEAQTDPHLPLAGAAAIPRDGTYLADRTGFLLDHMGDQVRLRFADNEEVFYLSTEAAPLGARVFKYDTGAEALRVTGWGGVTLYTPDQPSGIPAEYIDVVHSVDPPPVAAKDVKLFAAGLAKELAARTDFAVGFAADWDELSRSAAARMLACDAMRDATYALEQAANSVKRNVISDELHVVHVIEGKSPSAAVRRGVLTITVDPKTAPSARPSSLAIARVLAAAF